MCERCSVVRLISPVIKIILTDVQTTCNVGALPVDVKQSWLDLPLLRRDSSRVKPVLLTLGFLLLLNAGDDTPRSAAVGDGLMDNCFALILPASSAKQVSHQSRADHHQTQQPSGQPATKVFVAGERVLKLERALAAMAGMLCTVISAPRLSHKVQCSKQP